MLVLTWYDDLLASTCPIKVTMNLVGHASRLLSSSSFRVTAASQRYLCRGYATSHLTHDLISFHKSLTEIESTSGNEGAVGNWLAENLKAQGYNVEKQYLCWQPERFNVLAWPGSERDAKVLLTSHIDTVRLPRERRL